MRYTFIILLSVFVSCTPSTEKASGPEKPKIFYLNSYHKGYKSSDDIRQGFDQVMQAKDVNVRTFYMDTKRIDADQVPAKVEEALKEIDAFQPDVLVVSDDNAVKYVVEPHLKNGPYPVLFTGVNWSSEQYDLPKSNVSGMLEILPIEAALDTLLQYYPDMQTVAVLSEASTSEQKNVEVIRPLLESNGLNVTYALVKDFSAWKEAFVLLNQSADVLFLPTNGSVKNWDDDEASRFVEDNISKPVFTCDDFMMRYAAFGLTKKPQEMGEWAAKQALQILLGTEVSDIPITENKTFEAWINQSLAEEIGFEPDATLKETLKDFNGQ